MSMKDKSYSESFQMKYGEGDFLGRVRPATLMRHVEHVALKHAEKLGISRDFNEAHHMVFLLAKQAIEFQRMPRADEVLTFVTTPEQSKRITFRRVTVIYDAAGQEVACVDSIWFLMNLDTHKILRRSPVKFDENWAQEIERTVDMKIPKVDQLTVVGNFTASYAQCDTNGHINNANYFDVVCDLLPIQQLKQRALKRIVINYHRELTLGNNMLLQVGSVGQDIYATGTKDDAVTFEAFCVFNTELT